MPGHSPKLNPAKTTLRDGRALFYKLLRTFIGTVVIMACGLYYIKDLLLPAPATPPPNTAAGVKRTARRPALNKPPHSTAPLTAEMVDSLSLIKIPKTGASTYGKESSSAKSAAKPRLKTVTFAGSGGSFVPIRRDEPGQEPDSRAANSPRDQEAVQLTAAALSKKVKVKGARPVPVLTGKKYSGIDPEAEFLRGRMRRQAEAAKAAEEQLRHEKLLLTGWLALLALAAMLIPSRVIKAWRLINKPEGSHWTLK